MKCVRMMRSELTSVYVLVARKLAIFCAKLARLSSTVTLNVKRKISWFIRKLVRLCNNVRLNFKAHGISD